MQDRKKILDYLPLTILIVEASFMIYDVLIGYVVFKIHHLIALVLLLVITFGFIKNHQLGLLILGLSILLGMFSVAVFDAAKTTSYFAWQPFGLEIPLFWGNPLFLLWFIIHFAISRRYYFGILNKNYWMALKSQITNPKS